MASGNRDFNKQSDGIASALYEITECGITSKSMEEYYEKVHKVIRKLIYAENFFIARYDQKTDSINFVYFVDEVDTSLSVENFDVFSPEDLKNTLTGYVLKTKRTQHLDSEKVIKIINSGVAVDTGSDSVDWLGVPMLYQDELLGAMVIQSYKDDVIFGDEEVELLEFVARQVAMLLKSKVAEEQLLQTNKDLEEKVEERTHSLQEINVAMSQEINERRRGEKIQKALFEITELVSTSASQVDFFTQVHKIVSELMYAKNFYIAIFTDDKKLINFPYFIDENDENPVTRKVKSLKNGGLSEKIIGKGKTLLFNRTPKDGEALTGTNCNSFLGIPLKERRSTFGVLAVQSYEADIFYDDKHEELLTTIANQVAISILRKRDSDSLVAAHKNLENRVKERTSELEDTIVKRKIIEKKLAYGSLHDALTGLPNRLFLSNQVSKLLSSSKSDNHSINNDLENNFALLFLDLDRFKLINDSLGHHVGDVFLQKVSEKLTSCLRKGDIVVRLGGDEFCILMVSINSAKAAINLASRILKALKEPVIVNKHSLITSASIGIRLANTQNANADEILADADAAMYQAKHLGKNCFCLFDSYIKKIVTNRMTMENELREAVAKKELYLVYQPVLNIATNTVVGFEALLRWNHKTKGFISPEQFIPVAEETGLIVELGEFVAEEAVSALVKFSKNRETKNLFININVSTIQILSRTFDEFIRQLISNNNITPSLLNIEITESILIEDYKAATNFVRELKSMGLNIYLDDFGTGFSSLSYLHQFPFDVIKLDKSFVDMMNHGEKNLAIVESIASMANNLKMKIVAEGIESKEQLATLKKFDYQFGQGYYFSKPIPFSEVGSYLKIESVVV
ncbi:MAG: diguanylate cyclase (GGDEF)-like protein [Polaribacter sp.]|jgi:diguanylate cyclase (GGDEF)-like protein